MTTSTRTVVAPFSPAVAEWIDRVSNYIDAMRAERVGYGRLGEAEVAATTLSFTRALSTLTGATGLWRDGASELSMVGFMGPIHFGMIAHRGTPAMPEWEFPPVQFSLHS